MAMSRPISSKAVENSKARQLILKHLFDRVEVIAGQLEYTLIPSSIYTQLSSIDDPNGNNESADTTDSRDEVLVCVDDHLVYARFFADFGPLDLGQTVRFCQDMTARLTGLTPRQKIVLYSSEHPHKRANTMTLLALFLVICRNQSPEDAIKPFQTLKPAFGFRDAACGVGTFFISILDCARAVYKAMKAGIWSYSSFSLDEYEHYDQLQHGDINWIIPGKILAFSGPQQERIVLDEKGSTTLLAHDYAKVFQRLGVTCVVRFNEPSTYDRRAFIQANIRHLDMLYPDGGIPSDEILYKFLRTCERESGAIAVHCKAGLGRTGTNIAAYLMMHYRFTAVEAIAWCRICRPGSIVGPQQQFLVVKEPLLWQAAADHEQSQQPTSRMGGLSRPGPKKQQFAAMLRRLPAPEQTQTQLRIIQQSRNSLG